MSARRAVAVAAVAVAVAVVAVAVAVVVVAEGVACAQIVNVQPLIGPDTKDGVLGAVEAAGDYRTGNNPLVLFSGNLVARYRHRRHLLFTLAHGEIGFKNHVTFLDKDLEHLRYRVLVGPALDLESFVQHDRDAFRRIAVRVLGGAGARLRVVESTPVQVAAGLAYMIEYQQFGGGMHADAHDDHLYHRLSSYALVSVRVAERIRLGQTVYFQPRVDAPTDAHVLSETELAVLAAPHFTLKVTFSMAFDSRPPLDVQQLDTALRTSLQISY